jgi:threonine dehydrogenase-like Zn-dependent dehydrogenase
MADVGPMKVPEGMTDEQALFLTDILPTGWQAAENCDLKGGEIVAIWGAGPVGLFAIKSAVVMGAARVIAIETVPERIALAKQAGATDVIDFAEEDVLERIREITKGQGADAVIDCVGMESSGGHGVMGAVSAVQSALTSMQRPWALEQMVQAVRPSGNISVPGVYSGPVPVNMSAIVQKGITIKTGQTHVKRYLEKLTGLIQDGTIDPTFLITHRSHDLSEGPELYKTFRDKKDGCVKVVFSLS